MPTSATWPHRLVQHILATILLMVVLFLSWWKTIKTPFKRIFHIFYCYKNKLWPGLWPTSATYPCRPLWSSHACPGILILVRIEFKSFHSNNINAEIVYGRYIAYSQIPRPWESEPIGTVWWFQELNQSGQCSVPMWYMFWVSLSWYWSISQYITWDFGLPMLDMLLTCY